MVEVKLRTEGNKDDEGLCFLCFLLFEFRPIQSRSAGDDWFLLGHGVVQRYQHRYRQIRDH